MHVCTNPYEAARFLSFMHICMYACGCVCMYERLYVCTYVSVYVRICVSVYVRIPHVFLYYPKEMLSKHMRVCTLLVHTYMQCIHTYISVSAWCCLGMLSLVIHHLLIMHVLETSYKTILACFRLQDTGLLATEQDDDDDLGDDDLDGDDSGDDDSSSDSDEFDEHRNDDESDGDESESDDDEDDSGSFMVQQTVRFLIDF
jgi:hypothetical protein